MSAAADRPTFGRGTTIGVVLIGALAFFAVLYWLGTGGGAVNNGGGHVGGRGLNGYAALAAMLEADGVKIERARSKDALKQPGLLILTPPAGAEGKDLAEIISNRHFIGPTVIIAPKWVAFPDFISKSSKRGWTRIVGSASPEWKGYHDDIKVGFAKKPAGGWRGTGAFAGLRGKLPDDSTVQAGEGPGLEPLVETGDGRFLAAYVRADGNNEALAHWTGTPLPPPPDDEEEAEPEGFPVVLVFDPDLMDNWGLASRETGRMARQLLYAASGGSHPPQITFDLTLNGLGASRNLLSLAFEPPFLAATLCFLMALFAAGWRSFNRFGPSAVALREIPLGKTVLVRNTAGLIRRAGRLRLIAGPYADASRERLIHALGLPRGRPPGETEAAIDRLQARVSPSGPRYSELAARLRAARRTNDVVQHAAALQRLERDLIA